jgi:hypothetical protein
MKSAEQRSRSGTLSKVEMWGCLGIEVGGCQASQEKVIRIEASPTTDIKTTNENMSLLGLYAAVTILLSFVAVTLLRPP